MSIFKYLSHVEFLKNFLEERKASYPKWTQRKLALLSDISPSYFSNALKEKASFTQDHLFRVAETLKLSSSEKDYLMLIGEFQQCSEHKRKKYLETKVLEIQKENLRSETKMNLKSPEEDLRFYTAYFSDPYIKVVHVALGIARYSKNPKLLSEDLNLPSFRVEKILSMLEEFGVIAFVADVNSKASLNKKDKSNLQSKVEVLKRGFHLPEDHPLIWSHQTLLRQISIEKTANYSPEDKYSFSVTFSCEKTDINKIKSRLLDCLNDIQKDVKASTRKEVCQLNIDLFPWLS